MSDSQVWAGWNTQQRNEAVIDLILGGKSPLSAPPGSATPREIVAHMASVEFTSFAAEWLMSASGAANVYASFMQSVAVLMTVPEAGAKATIAAKDGVKLFSDVARDKPTVDPASDTSDATVQRAAEIVRNNEWKTRDADVAQEN